MASRNLFRSQKQFAQAIRPALFALQSPSQRRKGSLPRWIATEIRSVLYLELFSTPKAFSVLTRTSLVRRCWPIPDQARCIDLDCRRSAQGKLVRSTADSISTIVNLLLDSRLSFNVPLTFVSADGTSKSRQGLTEYETPSEIICTKTNDYRDVMFDNHATCALDDESGVAHSSSCFASCGLLNCPLNR